MKDKLLGSLGLCRKAGLLVLGMDPVAEAAASGKLRLILLAGDLSRHSAGDMRRVGEKHGVTVVEIPVLMDEIWHRVGKRAGILGVTDQGFADKLMSITSPMNKEE